METNDLEKFKAQAEEYLANWQKERADFSNYQKDEARRMDEFAHFANEDLILEVLEVLDDLEIAAKQVKSEGVNQIIKKFQELLKKYGVERIETGGGFNPSVHEAVEFAEGGKKLTEVRAGYRMHGKVIRPARVQITK